MLIINYIKILNKVDFMQTTIISLKLLGNQHKS